MGKIRESMIFASGSQFFRKKITVHILYTRKDYVCANN